MSETAKHREKASPFCQGSVLDIGSGGDPIVPHAIQFDLPQPYAHVGQGHIHLRGYAHDLPFKDGTLDAINASHVLEDYPAEEWPDVLSEWDRVLRPTGYLIIAVPDHKRFRAAVLRGWGDNLAHKHESRVGELTEHLQDRYVVLHDGFVNQQPDEYSILFIGRKMACLYATLRKIVRQWQPSSYLEIGVGEGDSLRIVLDAAGPGLCRVVLADNWSATYGGTGRGSHQHLAELPQLAGRNVRFLDGDSKATVPTLKEGFALITVDGDHSAAGAMADLENVLPLLIPGGRIVFDDVIHPAHSYLREVGEAFLRRHEDLLTLESSDFATPHGVMVFRGRLQRGSPTPA